MPKFKIATWNVRRPTLNSMRNSKIIDNIKKIDADVLILTETNSSINLGESCHCYPTGPSARNISRKDASYGSGENQVTIWSKEPAIKTYETYDSFSSVCVCIDTPRGALNVYGTVIGYRGNRHPAFNTDLEKQIGDWRELRKLGNLCIAGDFNITFSDNYYYTKVGRRRLNECFDELELRNLTGSTAENIDHIVLSDSFLEDVSPISGEWNKPKDLKISDHMGVWVTL